MYIPMCIMCPGGVIGRHDGFKFHYRMRCEGSSPFPGILVPMVKLENTQDLGSCAERHVGSNPTRDIRCIFEQNIRHPQQSEQSYFNNTHLFVQHSVVGYGSVTQSVSVLGS